MIHTVDRVMGIENYDHSYDEIVIKRQTGFVAGSAYVKAQVSCLEETQFTDRLDKIGRLVKSVNGLNVAIVD